jgi:endonuclease YncB( thermonuclease family)
MTRRLPSLIAAVTTAAAAAVFAVPAQAGTLYVAPNGGGGACSSGSPCGSLDAGYRAAHAGDVVVVRGGSYGRQEIPALGRSGPAIDLRAAPGASVVVSGIDVRADHVILRGMRSTSYLDVDSGNTSDPVEDVRFVNMDTKSHWINNARNFVWSGGSIGPSFNEKASMIGGQPASRNLTYDGILWHDATRDDQGIHMECFYAASVQGLTIRNSRFTNCAVYDLFITRIVPDPNPSSIVLENNVFEESKDIGPSSSGYYVFGIHGDVRLDKLVLRNNVLEQPFQADPPSVQGGRFVGNIVASAWNGADCWPALSYSHNVFTKGRCVSSDTVAPKAFSQFENPSRGNYRLRAGAAAIDAGDPHDAPATDAFGDVRPFGRAPDAGVDEYGSHPPGGSHGTPGPSAPRTGSPTRRKARVLKVLNGRTLRVKIKGGHKRTVRLLGIKVPRAKCGGRFATARLRKLAPKGKFVIVVRDRRARARDKHGRMLAYVVRKRHDIGRIMIARGWARVAPGTRHISRRSGYAAAQAGAKHRRLGLWHCG